MIASTVVFPHGFIGRLLEFPAMRFIGKISYSLYLWQQPFFILDSAAAGGLKMFQQWPLAPLGVGVCAIASYYLVEQPVIRFGANLRRRRLRNTEIPVPAKVPS